MRNLSWVWVDAAEILANWEARNENQDYSHWIYFLKKSVQQAKQLGYDTTTQVDWVIEED